MYIDMAFERMLVRLENQIDKTWGILNVQLLSSLCCFLIHPLYTEWSGDAEEIVCDFVSEDCMSACKISGEA